MGDISLCKEFRNNQKLTLENPLRFGVLRGFSINSQIQTSILFSKIAHSNVQKIQKLHNGQCNF